MSDPLGTRSARRAQQGQAPGGVTATGVQRAIGERRRRRMRERGGELDLDATMSKWPTPDPPTRPRAVVRPRRAAFPDVTGPLQPTLHQAALRALVPEPATNPRTSRPVLRGGRQRPPAAPALAGEETGLLPPVRVPGPAAAGPDSDASFRPPHQATQALPARRRARRSAEAQAGATGALVESLPAAPAPPGRPALAGEAFPLPAEAVGTDPFRTVTAGPGAATRPELDDAEVRHRAGREQVARDGLPEPRGSRSSRLPVPLPVAVALVAVLVVAVTVAVVAGVRAVWDSPQAADLRPPSAPAQDTLLVTLVGDENVVSRALVLAVGPDGVTGVTVPSDVSVAVPDAGTLPLSQSLSVSDAAPQRGVEDLLGISVGGTWVLTPQTLSELVQAAGGAVVDVDQAVTVGDVSVPAGPDQRLVGAQAAAFVAGAPDAATADARFGEIVLAFVSALPGDRGDVTQIVSETERDPLTTATSEQLTDLLTDAAGRIASPPPDVVAVPTVQGEGDSGLVSADPAGVAQIVSGRLAGASLPTSTLGPLRVVVGNATGRSGLVASARDRLIEAGFRYAGNDTETAEDPGTTVVLVPDDDPDTLERGEAVAAALEVSDAELQVREDFDQVAPAGTDVVVRLGEDFAETVQEEAS